MKEIDVAGPLVAIFMMMMSLLAFVLWAMWWALGQTVQLGIRLYQATGPPEPRRVTLREMAEDQGAPGWTPEILDDRYPF